MTDRGISSGRLTFCARRSIVILTGKAVTYTYGDGVWKDKLTAVGDKTISYDAQGNPTSYLGHTLTWEKGRQLKSFDSNTYTYNANGIRTSKTVNGVKHTYTLDGAKILRETWGDNVLIPLYDNEDSVCGIVYNGTPYYFKKNLQGDVMGIYTRSGASMVLYSYDAWGVCTISSDSTDCGIGNINPFRYRGYYYDAEIDMYYLQSRYYDPNVGRFIGTDKVMGANGDHAAYDLYSYCANCPVDRIDNGGAFWKKAWNSFKKAVRTVLNKTNKVLVSIGIDTAAFGSLFLNMTRDSLGIYHADFDCWQQHFGYNDFYDFMFDIGTSMESKKFEFSYRYTNYALWAWKGNYINLGAGAELGIYYCHFFRGPHWFVEKKLAMYMSMKLKYRGTTIIDYGKTTWWLTGFNPNPKYFDVKASDLKVTFTVCFTDEGLYNAFKSWHRNSWSFPSKLTAKYTF